MILWWGFKGIHPAQMNSMVPGSHMGRLLCPKGPLKNNFSANSPKSGKLVQALAHPCVFPIALRALVALFPLFGVYDGFIRNTLGGFAPKIHESCGSTTQTL